MTKKYFGNRLRETTNKLKTRPYDLEIYQVKAIKDNLLTSLIVSESDWQYKSAHLLWLREPFVYLPANQGESAHIFYKADGNKIKIDAMGEEREIEINEDEWCPSKYMHPSHCRFFMFPVWDLRRRPEEISAELLRCTGVEYSQNGNTLKEKLEAWWIQRYQRRFSNESFVWDLDGPIRRVG